MSAKQVFFAIMQARMQFEPFLHAAGIFLAQSLAALMLVDLCAGVPSVRIEFLASHRLSILHAADAAEV